jgi:sodium/potassium-transporting ATPase subunit alpha
MVGIIASSMGVLFFIINIIIGYDYITNIILVVGLVTGNIPEGLLITLTVTLALAAKRMAAKKVLVKNMQSVETLGSTSCICSDKTGTLTQNRMTVSHLFYDLNTFDASTNFELYKKSPNLERTYHVDDPGFQELIQSIALGTKATFSYTPSIEEMKEYLAKRDGKRTNAYATRVLTDIEKKDAGDALMQAERSQSVLYRKTAGDASEAGLIKFCHPICDINETR